MSLVKDIAQKLRDLADIVEKDVAGAWAHDKKLFKELEEMIEIHIVDLRQAKHNPGVFIGKIEHAAEVVEEKIEHVVEKVEEVVKEVVEKVEAKVKAGKKPAAPAPEAPAADENNKE